MSAAIASFVPGVRGKRDVAEGARDGARERRIVFLAARRRIELVAHRVGVPVRAIPVDRRVGKRHDLERVRVRRRADRNGEHDAAVGAREFAEAHERRAVGQEDADTTARRPGHAGSAAPAGAQAARERRGHDGPAGTGRAAPAARGCSRGAAWLRSYEAMLVCSPEGSREREQQDGRNRAC